MKTVMALFLSIFALSVNADSPQKIGVVNYQEVFLAIHKHRFPGTQEERMTKAGNILISGKKNADLVYEKIQMLEKKMLYRATAQTRARQQAELTARRAEYKKTTLGYKTEVWSTLGVSKADAKKSYAETDARITQFGKSNNFAAIYNTIRMNDLLGDKAYMEDSFYFFEDSSVDITAEILKNFHADMAATKSSAN